MTVKEKLVELIGQVQDCGFDVSDVVEMNHVENAALADHLIANGVTVAVPCSECIYSDMGEDEFCHKRIIHERWNGSYFERKEHKLESCGYGKRRKDNV